MTVRDTKRRRLDDAWLAQAIRRRREEVRRLAERHDARAGRADPPRWAAWVLLVVLAALFAALSAVLAHAAPVPERTRPRALPPAALHMPREVHVGHWRLSWAGGSGRCSFLPCGTWHCQWQGRAWVGRWWWSQSGRLVVHEGRVGGADGVPEDVTTWDVTLDATGLAGVLRGGADGCAFRLEEDAP